MKKNVTIGQKYRDNDGRSLFADGMARIGEVVALDGIHKRAQLRWNTNRKTWVAFDRLKSNAFTLMEP